MCVNLLQVMSSILFLTAAGGPTVVLDQNPSAGLADRGWLVQPCPNHLLAFNGNLLHGVVPGQLLTLFPQQRLLARLLTCSLACLLACSLAGLHTCSLARLLAIRLCCACTSNDQTGRQWVLALHLVSARLFSNASIYSLST